MSGAAESILPRLVAYTREDKAAKGLRTLRAPKAAPEPPIHFTALEMIQEERALILTAPPGGGRTTLALGIARALARAAAGDGDALDDAPVRNDRGDVAPQAWRLGPALSAVVAARPGWRLEDAFAEAGREFAAALRSGEAGPLPLLIVDDAERLGDGWRDFAAGLPGTLAAYPRLRLLLLGEARVAGGWTLPEGMTRHSLLPLPPAERRRALVASGRVPDAAAALVPAASHPGIFALALDLGAVAADAGAEDIVDRWLGASSPEMRAAARRRPWLAALLDAAELAASRDPLRAVERFAADPEGAAPVIASLLARWRADRARAAALVAALLDLPGDGGRRAALCVVDHMPGDTRLGARLDAALLDTVRAGALRPLERIAAGRALSRRGDPRDLEAMIDIPGGMLAMGCASNLNSSPPHRVAVSGFRIGAYPVTNARYAAFVDATGRRWPSEPGRAPERANMPATDLTWHDARAFCAWLTPVWRREGRIAADEIVRLPTEPEWERAATSRIAPAASSIPGVPTGTTTASTAKRPAPTTSARSGCSRAAVPPMAASTWRARSGNGA